MQTGVEGKASFCETARLWILHVYLCGNQIRVFNWCDS